MFVVLLLLCCCCCNVANAVTIRGHQISFFGEEQQRKLETNEPELWILQRNGTAPPPIHPLKLITKNSYLIWSTEYTNPLKDDQIGPWTLEMKGGIPTIFPVLIHVSPGYVFPQATRFGVDLWVLNHTFSNLETIINSHKVLWIDSFKPVKMHSQQARNVHFSTGDSPGNRLTGTGIIISISDTGLDASHCAFYDPDHSLPVQGEITPSSHSKIASMVTAVPGLTDYRGANGAHGTATAGSAAGYQCTNNVVGTASGARLAYYDFTPPGTDTDIYLPTVEGTGVMTYYDYLELIINDGGATVITGSWGSDSNGDYDSIAATLDEISYHHEEVNIFFSVGNTYGMPASPGGIFKNGAGIGASFGGSAMYQTIWSDSLVHPENYGIDRVADFSSHGPLPLDGRKAPILYSPGVYEYVPYAYYNPINGHSQYTRESGTSFSAPSIAGVAAYLQARYKTLNPGKKPTGSLILAQMIAWTIPMTGTMSISNSGTTRIGTDHANWYGYGTPQHIGLGTDVMDHIATGEVKGYCYRITANSTSQTGIALAWKDIPTVPHVSKVLVNDLNMYVFTNSKLVYSSTDSVNPTELARLTNILMVGDTLRVVIREYDGIIQNSPQNFSFHVSFDGLTPISADNCGTCLGTEYLDCLNSNEIQYCDPGLGVFTTCLPKTVGAVTCNAGYYFNVTLNTCSCIPGYRVSNTLECTSDGLTFAPVLGSTQNIVVQNGMVTKSKPSKWLGLVMGVVVFFI